MLKKSEAQIKDLDNRFDQKIDDLIIIFDQKLEDQINLIEKKLHLQVNGLTEKVNEVSENLENIRTQINNQKDDLININNEVNQIITETTSKIGSELKEIKGQQDVLKVSFDVLEKKILEEAKSMIYGEVRMACKDKEDELLMDMWIDELKQIIKDFDKLKEMNPKDLKIQIDEISNIITSFKEKIA